MTSLFFYYALNHKPSQNDYLINIYKLLAEIPDNDLTIKGNYSIWIKRMICKNKKINTSGLLIALFDKINEEDIKKLCFLNNKIQNKYIISPSSELKLNHSRSVFKVPIDLDKYYNSKNDFISLMKIVTEKYNTLNLKKQYKDTIFDLSSLRKKHSNTLAKLEKNINIDEKILESAVKELRHILNKNNLS